MSRVSSMSFTSDNAYLNTNFLDTAQHDRAVSVEDSSYLPDSRPEPSRSTRVRPRMQQQQDPSVTDHAERSEPSLHPPRYSSFGNGSLRSAYRRRFVLAIDFGTTRTGVAYSAGLVSGAIEIGMITNYGGNMVDERKVRSAISYINSQKGSTQWGSDIDKDRIAMINMKLELDPLKTRYEELDLTLQLLQRLNFLRLDRVVRRQVDDGFSAKPPEEVVTDFLKRVFEQTRPQIDRFNLHATHTPMDIVMTVPVTWSHEAQNTLYKALRAAGFNKTSFPTLTDAIVVTEPEAAVQATMRELLRFKDFFVRAGDCFILCDAGGGTVDAVAFEVKAPSNTSTSRQETSVPNWQYEMITTATGGQFGSAIIDTEFKRWLRSRLPEEAYRVLDPANRLPEQLISANGAETGPMRELIAIFEEKKCLFGRPDTGRRDIIITLPAPLQSLDVAGLVDKGALTIRYNTMKKLMDKCVEQVVTLVENQVSMVNRRAGRRPRELLLVGGFGGSVYLQDALRDAFKGNRERGRVAIHVRAPEPVLQTTAVVSGAVLYGLEKDMHHDAVHLTAVKKSYGVVIRGDFQWLVKEGDSVSDRRTREIVSKTWTPNLSSEADVEFQIYSYVQRDRDDFLPRQWSESRNEVDSVRRMDISRLDSVRQGGGCLKWRWKVHDTNRLSAELLSETSGEEVVLGSCSCELEVEVNAAFTRQDDGYSSESE